MGNKKILLFLSFAFLLGAFFLNGIWHPEKSAFASSFQFSRNLKFGSVGDDVKELQIILNRNPKTQVAASGVGSPGNETSFFGSLTKTAVAAFQELYASDILAPLGLSKGTGYFGKSTRDKINNLSSDPTEEIPDVPPPAASLPNPETPVPSKTTPVFDDTSIKEAPEIAYPSAYVAKKGDRITVTGENFLASGNTIHLGTYTIQNLGGDSSNSLSFVVPSDAPDGKYNMTISNKNGESNERLFIVKNTATPEPVITSVNPTSGAYGSIVTLAGSGFTSQGNDIYSTYDLMTDISSDGKTLRFSVAPFKNIPELQAGLQPKQPFDITEYFYVVNKNGISNVRTFVLHFD